LKALFLNKKFSKAPSAEFGINIWRDDFNEGEKLFDKRYNTGLNQLNYPTRKSLSGEFEYTGPLASNDNL